MEPAPAVPVEERRRRVGVRHALATGAAARDGDPVDLAGALVGLHATDPSTIYLSVRARLDGFAPADLEAALYEDRTLTKALGMRRTLFVVPDELAAIVQAACTDDIAARSRRRLVKEVEDAAIAADGTVWLDEAERATLATLDALAPATGAELSRAVPAIQAKIPYGEGKAWGGEIGVATQVLGVLAAEGRIRRGRPAGSWTSSQHRWEHPPPPARSSRPSSGRSPGSSSGEWSDPDDAVRELVDRWLRTFGPATETDVVWWTGLTKTKVRRALAALDVVEVDLDGERGLAHADDLEPTPDPGPWVALLPALDPTTMGWRERHWYLGDLGPALFDRNGNAGPTVWADGRVVGGWAQRSDGRVAHRLLVDVGSEAAAAIEAAAHDLGAWLGDTVVTPRFPTPLARELREDGDG